MLAIRRVGVVGLLVAAGCNQLVGFKDVELERDASTAGSDAQVIDAAKDAAIDGPPPKLFTFLTDASFVGGFGSPNGARATADIKCQDKYAMSFTALSCTEIHAVIQIDDTVDTVARMKITFPTLPLTVGVKRATDDTPVANSWDEFVDPNDALLAPITTSAVSKLFWSGRSASGTNFQCANWTSSLSTNAGTAGDATKTNAWFAQANQTCDNFDQHFVCVCW